MTGFKRNERIQEIKSVSRERVHEGGRNKEKVVGVWGVRGGQRGVWGEVRCVC